MAGFLGRLLQRATAATPALVPRHAQAYEAGGAVEPGVAAAVGRAAWPVATGDAASGEAVWRAADQPVGEPMPALALERFSLRGAARVSSVGLDAAAQGLADGAPAGPARVLPAAPPNLSTWTDAPRQAAPGAAASPAITSAALLPAQHRRGAAAFGAPELLSLQAARAADPVPRSAPDTRGALGRDAAQRAGLGHAVIDQQHRSNQAPEAAAPGTPPQRDAMRLPPLPPPLPPPSAPAPGANANANANANAVRGVLLAPPAPSPSATASSTAAATAASDPAGPTIHVTIGRIELRANAPASAGSPPRRAAAAPPPAALSLADYLARRQGGGPR